MNIINNKSLKGKASTLYPMKKYSMNGGKIKTLSDEGKLEDFITRRSIF